MPAMARETIGPAGLTLNHWWIEPGMETRGQYRGVTFRRPKPIRRGKLGMGFSQKISVKNGDPTGNRTRATSVKGRCPNR